MLKMADILIVEVSDNYFLRFGEAQRSKTVGVFNIIWVKWKWFDVFISCRKFKPMKRTVINTYSKYVRIHQGVYIIVNRADDFFYRREEVILRPLLLSNSRLSFCRESSFTFASISFFCFLSNLLAFCFSLLLRNNSKAVPRISISNMIAPNKRFLWYFSGCSERKFQILSYPD